LIGGAKRKKDDKSNATFKRRGMVKGGHEMIENIKLFFSIISIVLLYVVGLILIYRWLIEKYFKSRALRLTLSMANGLIIFIIISSVLFAKFLPTHKFNVFLILIGISGFIGSLLGFTIHQHHKK
jgi:hypothetical protein